MSAMMVKLQVVPLLFALPVLVLAFGQPALQPRFPWQKLGSQPIIIATVCGSAAFTIPALTMIFGQALLHDWAIYQLVIAIYFVSAIVIYTRIYHHDWRTALIAISAVATGWSAAQYLHLLTNDIDNTGALANFIEHMMKFTNIDHNNSLSTGLSEIFLRAFRATVLRSFDLSSSAAFPLRALYFLSIPGLMILAWSRNYKRLSQCLLLLGTAFLMEVYCGLRGWTPRYYIFSTPWLIAGFGLLTSTALIELKNTNTSSMVQKVAGIGVLVTVAWISLQSFSLAISERRWQEPVNLCYQTQSYMHRLPGAFDRFCPK